MRRADHNHLRITRIIRSLRVLGLEDEALAFYQRLKQIYSSGEISPRSFMFWTRAAERPLNIAPEIDNDEDNTTGPQFLRDFERLRKEVEA